MQLVKACRQRFGTLLVSLASFCVFWAVELHYFWTILVFLLFRGSTVVQNDTKYATRSRDSTPLFIGNVSTEMVTISVDDFVVLA